MKITQWPNEEVQWWIATGNKRWPNGEPMMATTLARSEQQARIRIDRRIGRHNIGDILLIEPLD